MMKIITDYFTEKLNLDDYQQKLFAHGLDIIFCDGSEFFFTLVFSAFLSSFKETLVYLVLFALLRINTGGWHARTRGKCFMVFESLYILFFISLKITIPITTQVFLMLLSSCYIRYNSPVEHWLQPLTDKEISFCRYRIKYVLIFIFVFYVISYFIYYPFCQISMTVMVYNVLLMAVLKNSPEWRYAHED